MQTTRKRMFFGIMTILFMCAIFFFSAQNGEVSGNVSGRLAEWLKKLGLDVLLPVIAGGGTEGNLRKWAHVAIYFGLGFSSCGFLLQFPRRTEQKTILCSALFAFLFCLVYAGLDEWHQTFVPGRSGQPLDVLMDVRGFAASIFLMAAARAIREKSHRKKRKSD